MERYINASPLYKESMSLAVFDITGNCPFYLLFVFVSDEISRYHPINKNAFKPPVDEKIKDIVRRNFTKEIEFYEFCKQRLHKQYIALKLPQK